MIHRRLPIGAELQPDGGAHFRVWAPNHSVDVVFHDGVVPLEPEAGGYHSASVPRSRAQAGTLYRYRVDGRGPFPDPASRSQPEGPHGPSEIVDPAAYRWTDGAWSGAALKGQVVYELHVGTFTEEGTFASAARELARLKDLGVTLLEVMPIAAFAGRFGWGYDGVDLFAPTHLYGSPDDLRKFVDQAHGFGIGVILDVVYNHFGPDGCYLREFSTSYFTDRHANDWGEAIDFDGESSGPVREFFVSNAAYWIDEYHLDGLRLDATQSIHDDSPQHVLAAITLATRRAAKGRSIVLIAENESQTPRLARPIERGGYGIDALWNDDFHHAAVAAATGSSEAYYSDTPGKPQEFIAATKWGFLFQGQRYAWQKNGRGAPALDLPSPAFVSFLENHDQVANTARGTRLRQRASPAVHRALVALTLLSPQTPLLFQGEEFGSTSPFLYFADHAPELGAMVRSGRAEFLKQFPFLTSDEAQAALDDPGARTTFERCKLDPSRGDPQVATMYRDLLRLRREDPAFAQQRGDRLHGTVLGDAAFALRFLCEDGDRLLIVNLGPTLRLESIADPMVAPPQGAHWETHWSSEEPKYGGDGVGPVDTAEGWRIGGHQTTALRPPPVNADARSKEGGRSAC